MPKEQAEYIGRVGTSFSVPRDSGSASSHVSAPFRLHKVYSIKVSALQLVSQLVCSIPLVVVVNGAILAPFQTTRIADSIQPLSLPVGLSRMYTNILANVVCVSLHYRSHGEGEDPMVISPMEPVGRRRDPMGHLPFWQGPIVGMSTGGGYETFFWESDAVLSAETLPSWVTSHKSGTKGTIGL